MIVVFSKIEDVADHISYLLLTTKYLKIDLSKTRSIYYFAVSEGQTPGRSSAGRL